MAGLAKMLDKLQRLRTRHASFQSHFNLIMASTDIAAELSRTPLKSCLSNGTMTVVRKLSTVNGRLRAQLLSTCSSVDKNYCHGITVMLAG
jgi:hypothetical protein